MARTTAWLHRGRAAKAKERKKKKKRGGERDREKEREEITRTERDPPPSHPPKVLGSGAPLRCTQVSPPPAVATSLPKPLGLAGVEGLATGTQPEGCCLPTEARNRKEPLYLENEKPHFLENFYLPLPQNQLSSSSTFPVVTGRSSSSQPNILPKHGLILPSWSQNRGCFKPRPSCLQLVAQSGAMEFPFGETGRRTNPLYRKDATSCSPEVCNELSWVAH